MRSSAETRLHRRRALGATPLPVDLLPDATGKIHLGVPTQCSAGELDAAAGAAHVAGRLGDVVGRTRTCARCNVDLHACVQCDHHDPRANNECREPNAERLST